MLRRPLERYSQRLPLVCSSRQPRVSGRSLHSVDIIAPLEEQTLPGYHEKQFYPARIGQTIHQRYRLVAKLGYGAYSTVALAKDQITQHYAALKICIKTASTSSPITNELRVLQHLRGYLNDHPGVFYTRLMDDGFQIDGHECIVMSPQACSVEHLRQLCGSHGIPRPLLVLITMNLLASVNWLHVGCGLVHTAYISPQNILLTAPDDAIYQRIEQEEMERPSTPIYDDSHPHPHPIYKSKVCPVGISDVLSGGSVLADFGHARFLQVGELTRGWCMPDTYRAPEVLMQVPFDHLIDVWSIAVMLLELVEGRNLFTPFDMARQQYVVPLAMAQYIGYLGLPPVDMIRRSENAHIRGLFDEQGQWKGEVTIPTTSLEDFVTVIPPGQEKTQFLAFIRRMLTWEGSQRMPTAFLLEDEWLR